MIFTSLYYFCCVSFLVDHFASLQSQHDHALQSVQDQKQLITQLESDLARVRPFLPPRTEGEV